VHISGRQCYDALPHGHCFSDRQQMVLPVQCQYLNGIVNERTTLVQKRSLKCDMVNGTQEYQIMRQQQKKICLIIMFHEITKIIHIFMPEHT
jgi:hypothetical protein